MSSDPLIKELAESIKRLPFGCKKDLPCTAGFVQLIPFPHSQPQEQQFRELVTAFHVGGFSECHKKFQHSEVMPNCGFMLASCSLVLFHN